MGSSTNSKQKTEIRYAGYIEEEHERFLNRYHDLWESLKNDSPYGSYIPIATDAAFFCVGYTIGNFPCLYDMYGKYMAGLDIEQLWHYSLEDIVNDSAINSTIAEEMKLLDDKIIEQTIPDFQIKMRDMNSVISSSFVVGKAAIENARLKALSRISSNAKLQTIPEAEKQFVDSLNWNKKTVANYAEAMKLYYMTKMDVDEANYKFDTKDKLWPLEVLDFERAALGALQRATNYEKTMERERSTLSKGLLIASYTVSGLYIGSSIGGVWGAVIGAVIGCIIGIAYVLLE